MGVGEKERVIYAPIMDALEDMGLPMMDGILGLPLVYGDDHVEIAKKVIGDLPVGITHFVLHPSVDTPELRAIAPDWQARVANYNAFMSDDLKMFLESEDVKLIGYRDIRDVMRS